MDLVTFTEGIQSIRIQDVNANTVDTSTSRPFVPLGESIIKHTEKLFSQQSSNQELLLSFLVPISHQGIDPNDYDTASTTTLSALTELKQRTSTTTDPVFHRTLKLALNVLTSLEQDRQLLKSNLTALEKV